jgi:hypothetical protein
MSVNFNHVIIPEAQQALSRAGRALKSTIPPVIQDSFKSSEGAISQSKKPLKLKIREIIRKVRANFGWKLQSSDLPRDPFIISEDERILPGYIHAYGVEHHPDLLGKPKFKEAYIRPKPTSKATGIVVNPKRDKHLREFLESPQLAGLRQTIPTTNASTDEEFAFLRNINDICTKQLHHKGLTVEERIARHEKRTAEAYISDVGVWLKTGLKGPKPRYEKTRSLGKTMQEADGVCTHYALLNKLILDGMENQGLKTSVQTGLVKLNPQAAGKFQNNSIGHAWVEVTMPSQQKYLVDTAHNEILQITHKAPDGQIKPIITKDAQLENKKSAYVSYPDVLKYGNPDFQKP